MIILHCDYFCSLIIAAHLRKKFHKKDPSDPMVSLKLQFVVDIRKGARLDCSANLRAHRLGHHSQAARRSAAYHSVARLVHERVKSKAPMLQTRRLVGSTDLAYPTCFYFRIL